MLSWMINRKRQLDMQEQVLRRDQEVNALEYEMKRRALQRDMHDQRRLAATRGTVFCIVGCGLGLAGLGVALTCTGILRFPGPRGAPWLVTGPTCIVMGILVLLLSVETILKCRRAQRLQQSDSKETLLERAIFFHKPKVKPGQQDTDIDAKAVCDSPRKPLVLDPQKLVEPLEVAA
ncbi:uncharacterized protein LOC135393518 [Ornithodoros turicata]|uniref:uncharacterized protein LOC135393518 n=1 Tax=Ornithodoros turicata TaxID=34597 RepID=UPI0031395F04